MLGRMLTVSLGCVVGGAFVIYYAETIGIALAQIGSGGRDWALPGCLIRWVGALLVAMPVLLFVLYFTHSLLVGILLLLGASFGVNFVASRLWPTNDPF